MKRDELSGKERRELRALGHHLRPVVQIGQHGITAAVVDATVEALDIHELVKVKVLEASPVDRHEAGRALAKEAGADLIQVLGRTLLLYKRRKEEGAKGSPPRTALHERIGGGGDRPAAKAEKRASTQGALPKARKGSQ